MSSLFNSGSKKLYHNRGLIEHIQNITNAGSYSSRAVQFTFTNDRADLVLRDGDIPGWKNACDPIGNEDLLGVEFANSLPSQVPEKKQVICLADYPAEGGTGGFIALPDYMANRRFDFESLKKKKSVSVEENRHGVEWGSCTIVAVRWGVAMYNYQQQAHRYKVLTGKEYDYGSYLTRRGASVIRKGTNRVQDYFDPPSADQLKARDLYDKLGDLFENVLRRYAALQEAELYAHFAPVSLIDHERIISDFPTDELGKMSIRDRIERAGRDRWYRIEYPLDLSSNDLSEEDERRKRSIARSYIEGEGLSRLIPTSLGATEYINNVIDAFVNKNEKVESQLYVELKDKL